MARELLLGKLNYVVDDILYHITANVCLRIVLPQEKILAVFYEIYQGKFAGHLRMLRFIVK